MFGRFTELFQIVVIREAQPTGGPAVSGASQLLVSIAVKFNQVSRLHPSHCKGVEDGEEASVERNNRIKKQLAGERREPDGRKMMYTESVEGSMKLA
ncbi:hypothetical protein HPP92_029040 [Vanilla planifolia]|uniref:Uncharacterized protein n=1 Tax=Vanilla planifolia TaxID=51239 RepID=A0A835P8N1_VANPL|nr:hypothetical protein HPP92_029040 [Vanilla planifolia]KAG0446032.1 hypothetical protein HPP92_029028 [Vanilla planifolia]